MLSRTPFCRWLAALATALLATPAWAGPGALLGVYAPAGAGETRFFAAVFDEDKDNDRRQAAILCTAFVTQNQVMSAQNGTWATCPFLVGSQRLMVGCVGPDGRLRYYVTACCQGNNVCVRGYRPNADAVPEFVPPGHGRDFQMGWDEITIGNFYNTFNIQFRCQTMPHPAGDPD